MKKPVTLEYGLDDKPPHLVSLLSALQHIGVITLFLVVPLLVSREARVPPEVSASILSLSMVAFAAAVLLQALRWGPVGCGYLAPSAFSTVYIGPSIEAISIGGLPLVFGMTVFSGFVEAALSRGLRPLRPFLPPELAGLVIFLIGTTTGAIGIRYILGVDDPRPIGPAHWAVAAATLATMVVLGIWTTGILRVSCTLIGTAVGYVMSILDGLFTADDVARLTAVPVVALPRIDHLGWTFDPAFAVPFAIGALATTLKAVAVVTMWQRVNDADWLRPDLRSISGGVLAEGLGSVASGLLGTASVTLSSASAGLAAATGVASRQVAWVISAILMLLAFVPVTTMALALMPRAVIGAMLLFTSCFILLNGVEMITSRMLDARKILTIGLAMLAGAAVESFPRFFQGAPTALHPLVNSSLVLGTIVGLVLNLVFRLGVRRTATLVVDPADVDPERVREFMEAQGAGWAARRDVVTRATYGLDQLIEAIVENCEPRGPMMVEASFDEFNLDIRARYAGEALELPDRRPTDQEIRESEDGSRRLAGFMLRRNADRVATSARAGERMIEFHFDH